LAQDGSRVDGEKGPEEGDPLRDVKDLFTAEPKPPEANSPIKEENPLKYAMAKKARGQAAAAAAQDHGVPTVKLEPGGDPVFDLKSKLNTLDDKGASGGLAGHGEVEARAAAGHSDGMPESSFGGREEATRVTK